MADRILPHSKYFDSDWARDDSKHGHDVNFTGPPYSSTRFTNKPHIIITMPLLVPGVTIPLSKDSGKKDDEQKETKDNEQKETKDTKEESAATTKKFDGRSAPGMEGMSEEAIKKFEEAMELEYQKREGGA